MESQQQERRENVAAGQRQLDQKELGQIQRKRVDDRAHQQGAQQGDWDEPEPAPQKED